ncbi:hypothetical protein HMPREF1208_01758, partial [Staphylococcus sp. HGB0015]
MLNSTISPIHTVATEVGETAFRAALAGHAERERSSGHGQDPRNKVPVYYELQVDSNGHKAIFKYTVSYDDPKTSTTETHKKLGFPKTVLKNTPESYTGMLKLGKDYGKPTKITQGITGAGYQSEFVTKHNIHLEGNAKSGYYWQTGVMDADHIKEGYGLTTIIEVPIINPFGDVTYQLTPYGSFDKVGGKRGQNYFSGVVSNIDPYKKYNPNGARAITESRHASTSLVKAKSESAVRSQSAAESQRVSAEKSTSIRDSEAKSNSIVESERLSTSKSTSIKNSEAKSQSVAESQRVSTSKSTSVKNSEAKSHSVAESQRLSASKSTSIKNSEAKSHSIVESKRLSTSKSTSVKNSEAKSHSIAESKRLSASKSTSVKNSEAKSHSIAESKRLSTSKSTSVKNSEAKSQSVAESQRVSTSKSTSVKNSEA